MLQAMDQATLLDALIQATSDPALPALADALGDLGKGFASDASSPEAAIDRAIAVIDATVSRSLAAILGRPEVQGLMAAWRGLAFVVERAGGVEVAFLPCTREELAADLCRPVDVAMTAFHRIAVADPVARPGGVPFGAILADLTFGLAGGDAALLARCALVAKRAQAPFLAAASPALLGIADFARLADARSPDVALDAAEEAAYSALRQMEEARYVGLLLPRFQLSAGPAVWINPVYAFASCLCRSFVRYGWCVNVVGPTDGCLDDVPAAAMEVPIDEALDSRIFDLGLVALAARPGAAAPAFFAARSLRQRRHFDDSEEGRAAAFNDFIAGSLPHLFIATRVASYVCFIARHLAEEGLSREEVAYVLEDFLGRHTADARVPPPEYRRRRPLRMTHFNLDGDREYVLELRPCFKYYGAFYQIAVQGTFPFPIGASDEPRKPLTPEAPPPAKDALRLAIAFSPDGRTLGACAEDGAVCLLDTERWRPRAFLTATRGAEAIGWTAAGTPLVLSHHPYGGSTTVCSWPNGVEAPAKVEELPVDGRYFPPGDPILSERFGEGETPWTLAATDLVMGYQRDVASTVELSALFGAARSLALFARVDDDGAVHVHDAATLRTRCVIEGLRPRALALSPEGRYLAVGGGDIRVWDVDDRRLVARLGGYPRPVCRLALSRGARFLAAACRDDRAVRSWDVATGRLIAVTRAHASWVRDIAFHPERELLATASSDSARLWDARTGRALLTILSIAGRWEVVAPT
jgi:type VI secretion system protein ImpC